MAGLSESGPELAFFAKSPVVEAAVGVEFLQLPGLRAVQMVQLHDLWGKKFPKVQEQPALPPTAPMDGQGGFQFQIGNVLPPLRVWMLSDTEDELLQVQNDRLFLNWRKTSEGDPRYPRYAYLRGVYQQVFTAFQQRVDELQVGTFRPHTAVVTYVNRFALEAGEALKDAFAPLDPNWDQLPGAAPEIRLSVPLGEPPQPRGRLIATANTDPTDGTHGYLEVSARIDLTQPSLDPFAGLDLAHEVCVTSFEKLTTPKMHERWGKQ
jgi:uncharacterized protein (TIGR04255 family)